MLFNQLEVLFRKFYRWANPQFDPVFDFQFRREITKTELLRINIVMWSITAGGAAGIINFLLLMEDGIFSFLYQNLYLFFGSLVVFLIYELLSRRYVKFCILKRRPLTRTFQAINVLAETSFPTIVALILLWKIQNVLLLVSPLVLVYFLFIVLSTLHLDFWLSMFSGLIAGVEYFLLTRFIIDKISRTEQLSPFLTSTNIILSRSIVIFICGVAAGLVALEIKRRVVNTYKATNDRNRIRQVLGQQVSFAIVDQIINENVEIGNKRLNVCVMFLDIRDFTPFAENRSPEEVMDFQNKIFGGSAEVIDKYNGIINQFMGDGFMATFGAPISAADDCAHALHAGDEILDYVRKLYEEGQIPYTRLGIGIHYGEAITGNVGTELRKQFSIVGNVVIQASRIEQLNKEFKSQLLISREVLERIDNLQGVSLGPITLKGESKPVEIFRIR